MTTHPQRLAWLLLALAGCPSTMKPISDPTIEESTMVSAEVQAKRNAALPDDTQVDEGHAPTALRAVYSRSDASVTLEWERPSEDPAAAYQYGVYRSYLDAQGQAAGAAEQVLLADNSILRTTVDVPKHEGQTAVFNVIVAVPGAARDGAGTSVGSITLGARISPTAGTVLFSAKCQIPGAAVPATPRFRTTHFITRTNGAGLTAIATMDSWSNNTYGKPIFFDKDDSVLVSGLHQAAAADAPSLATGGAVRTGPSTFAALPVTVTSTQQQAIGIAARGGGPVAWVGGSPPGFTPTSYQLGGFVGATFKAAPASETSFGGVATMAPRFGWIGSRHFIATGIAASFTPGAALRLIGRFHTFAAGSNSTLEMPFGIDRSTVAGILDSIDVANPPVTGDTGYDSTPAQGRTATSSWYGKSSSAVLMNDRQVVLNVTLRSSGDRAPVTSIALLDTGSRTWMSMNQRPSYDYRISPVVGSHDGKYLAAIALTDGSPMCLYVWPSNEDANFIGVTGCASAGHITAFTLGGATTAAAEGGYAGTWLPEEFSTGTLGASPKLVVRRVGTGGEHIWGAINVSEAPDGVPLVSLRTENLASCATAGSLPFYVSYRHGGTTLGFTCFSNDLHTWDFASSEALMPIGARDTVSGINNIYISWSGIGPEDEINSLGFVQAGASEVYDLVALKRTPLIGVTGVDEIVISGKDGARTGLVLSRGAQEIDWDLCSQSGQTILDAKIDLIEKSDAGWSRTGDVLAALPNLPAGERRVLLSWPEFEQNGDTVLVAIAGLPAGEAFPPRCGGVDPTHVRYYAIDLKACGAGACTTVDLTPPTGFNCGAGQMLTSIAGTVNRFSFAE